jgi:hypothetical protein
MVFRRPIEKQWKNVPLMHLPPAGTDDLQMALGAPTTVVRLLNCGRHQHHVQRRGLMGCRQPKGSDGCCVGLPLQRAQVLQLGRQVGEMNNNEHTKKA